MPEEAKDLLVSLPAWGIFAFLVLKLVLDYLAKRESTKTVTEGGLAKPPTPEEIAAVIRDQQERQELLETVRAQTATQLRIAEALDHVAAAQERIAAAQDRQTQLIERQASRTRSLAEAIATSRQTLDRLAASVSNLNRDADHIFEALGTARPREDSTPVHVPLVPSSGHRTG